MIANFRDLSQPWFLLGATGDYDGELFVLVNVFFFSQKYRLSFLEFLKPWTLLNTFISIKMIQSARMSRYVPLLYRLSSHKGKGNLAP